MQGSLSSRSKCTYSQLFKEKRMSDVVRIGSIIIFHKLWKSKFFILCDVIFLVSQFEIDRLLAVKGLNVKIWSRNSILQYLLLSWVNMFANINIVHHDNRAYTREEIDFHQIYMAMANADQWKWHKIGISGGVHTVHKGPRVMFMPDTLPSIIAIVIRRLFPVCVRHTACIGLNVQVYSLKLLKRKCISDVLRIGSIIIFHLSKLWKAKFSILYDVIFLARLQGKFEIDHSYAIQAFTLIA